MSIKPEVIYCGSAREGITVGEVAQRLGLSGDAQLRLCTDFTPWRNVKSTLTRLRTGRTYWIRRGLGAERAFVLRVNPVPGIQPPLKATRRRLREAPTPRPTRAQYRAVLDELERYKVSQHDTNEQLKRERVRRAQIDEAVIEGRVAELRTEIANLEKKLVEARSYETHEQARLRMYLQVEVALRDAWREKALSLCAQVSTLEERLGDDLASEARVQENVQAIADTAREEGLLEENDVLAAMTLSDLAMRAAKKGKEPRFTLMPRKQE